MDRGTVDAKLPLNEAYSKYLVWKQKPGTIFDYAADKKWYWVKKAQSEYVEYIVAELKSVDGKNAVLVPKGGIDVLNFPEAALLNHLSQFDNRRMVLEDMAHH